MSGARRGHLIGDHRLEVAAGLAAMGLGALLLKDAYEGRAKRQPVWLRPFAWW